MGFFTNLLGVKLSQFTIGLSTLDTSGLTATRSHALPDLAGTLAMGRSTPSGPADEGYAPLLNVDGEIPEEFIPHYFANSMEFAGGVSFGGSGSTPVVTFNNVSVNVFNVVGGDWDWIGTPMSFNADCTFTFHATAAAAFRDAVGLEIGADVQAYGSRLAALQASSALTPANTTGDIWRVPLYNTLGLVGGGQLSVYGVSLWGSADAAAARTLLVLGTAATVNTGTSGGTLGLLNSANTYSAIQTSTVNAAWSWNTGTVVGYVGPTSAPATGAAVGTSSNHPLYGFTNGAVRWTTDATGFNLASGHSYHVNGTKVVGARDTGWTASTGVTANKGANAMVTQTTSLTAAGATYNQAYTSAVTSALNTTNTEVNKLSARVRALEDMLRTHGLIN